MIMDPLYGYGAVNVEAQGRDPHSLLNWMRRMLAVRSRHPAFGRGKLTLLYPKNRKVLAYLRQYQDDTLLCVANVAHSPQAVELELSQFAGRVPVELNAGSVFPPIGELTYLLTLPPYGFYWFALATQSDQPTWHTPAPEPLPEFATIVIRDSLAKALETSAVKLIEDEALPEYLPNGDGSVSRVKQSRTPRSSMSQRSAMNHTKVCSVKLKSRPTARRPAGCFRWVSCGRINRQRRFLLASPWPACGVAARLGFLTDAFVLPDFARHVIAALAGGKQFRSGDGVIQFRPTETGRIKLANAPQTDVHWLAAEQSNSSLTIGDTAMLKIFRRVSPGQHPEAEMNRYLTAKGFIHAPSLLGDVVRIAPDDTRPH